MFRSSLTRCNLGNSLHHLALAAITLLTLTPAVGAAASLGRQGCAPNVEVLGFSDVLNKATFDDFAVAEISALAFDQQRRAWYAVADRAGPVHAHFFTIEVLSEVPTVTAVTVLKNADGEPFDGTTLDGEGIVLTIADELIVASEGGSAPGQQPEILRFTLAGDYLGELEVPARFLIGTNNVSFESLALSPSGQRLFTSNEGPLPSDGLTDDLRRRLRILQYENGGPEGFIPTAEYFYLTEPGRTDLGIAEMLALSDTDLLVLEREFVPNEGNSIRIFHASLSGAADVSSVDALAETETAAIEKRLVMDLADCPPGDATTPGVQPNPLLDNFEAMAWGSDLPDGRRQLIVLSDDNGSEGQVTRYLVLALSAPEAWAD